MIQIEKSPTLVVAFYCLAAIMLGYTLYNVILGYMMPIAASDAEIHGLLTRARTYQLIGNLLFISSFLAPGIYIALKDRKFRTMFPALEIFHLAFMNMVLLK